MRSPARDRAQSVRNPARAQSVPNACPVPARAQPAPSQALSETDRPNEHQKEGD